MAFRPEAQTLLTVVEMVESVRPAPMAHCLAGFCPTLESPVSPNYSNGCSKGNSPCRQDVAKENFLNIGGIDTLSPLNSRCTLLLALKNV